MKKIFLFLFILSILLPDYVCSDEKTLKSLEAIEKKYAGLRDYTADVHVHFDIETFKTPDMEAKLYFKIPDKLKIESKKIFFFPKEGGFFNPAFFKKEDYESRSVEEAATNRKELKLRIVPKKKDLMGREFILVIDRDENLIREVHLSQVGGRETRAEIEYMKYDSFDLPKRIVLNLDIPSVEPNESIGFGPPEQKPKRITGRIEITYSNYKINTGLKDDLFKTR